MAEDFYPFVGEGEETLEVGHAARIAVVEDTAVAPRVVVVEPKDVRDYLNEITQVTSTLAREQGGTIPFMVIREIVENFIHAYFQSPTITIMDGGNTIRFTDQGPGIAEKDLAMEYGTTSATEDMRRYIRGVGSGLPYVQQYMQTKGGSLSIEDNIHAGTVVTISTVSKPSVTPPAQTQNTQTTRPREEKPSNNPVLSNREEQVLSMLSNNGAAGPSDLVREYGGSAPTWSRTLKAMAEAGSVVKDGQKYHLTAYGRSLS